jgi:hypothetical protein
VKNQNITPPDKTAPQNFLELLTQFELSISEETVSLTSGRLLVAKGKLKSLIDCICNESEINWSIYSKLLESLNDMPRDKARCIALLIIRALDINGLIPTREEDAQIELKIVSMTSELLPDIAKRFELCSKKQTYQNFNSIKAIHKQILEALLPWSISPKTIEGIIANKNTIYRASNSSYVKSYLNHYDLSSVLTSLNEIYSLFESIADENNESFFTPIEKLQEVIENQDEYIASNSNFFSNLFYKPLLDSMNLALTAIKDESSERFKCDIKPKNSSTYLAEKKYPLHEVGREIIIRIPMINIGPGIAKDVSVEYYDNEGVGIVLSCFNNIGNIRRGPFELSVTALVVEQTSEFKFEFLVSWRKQGGTEREENIFSCRIEGQRPDINWEELRYEEPYSTEIAEGSEFVGRANKLNDLVKRALKVKMQSSYISGQKRIGKTSLAIAVTDLINREYPDKKIVTHYIEWGEVARTDPSDSVKFLGQNIAKFLLAYLPSEFKLSDFDFNGSISPLNELSNLLLKVEPERKFLVILDEFDEIHPEMYRYGKLAEAFFANLRTLSSKKNIAFMLVGGENMPFVISAQGDQLNRFVFESLDYFSKETEENDYSLLVTQPTEKNLNWSLDAIRELFYFTNGHPFYTKLICSEIFSSAVQDRDSEICNREINSAVSKLVERLDTNSFAHHWKDGIKKTEGEAELVTLNRCRCLVAMGRCIRDRTILTYENICNSNVSSNLTSSDIKAILSDFVRRQIIRESSVNFEFSVPFFEKWLANKGVGILIADTIGDDLAEAKINEEERLRVRPAEIESLVENWQPYRGRDITSEKVRFWLEQADSIVEQRLLFNLLLNLRFVTEIEIRNKLKTAHELIKTSFPLMVQTKKRQYRKDIVVSYIDGEAKSGQYFASRYAEENLIPSGNVISSGRFSQDIDKFESSQNTTINGIVLVDDIVATGKSISENLEKFLTKNQQFIKNRSLTVAIIVLISTSEGEKKISKLISKLDDINVDFRSCETLAPKHYAFSDTTRIWESQMEFDQAKALCNRLGSYIQKRQPLGYGDQGLLITFPDRCPNNTVPLLHGSSHGDVKWKPLFPRPKN